jgi:hypothetical protein
MDLHGSTAPDIQVDEWCPTNCIRVQIGEEFVDLSPDEVDALVVLLESNKESVKFHRKYHDNRIELSR